MNRSDVHHVYPRNYLKQGAREGRYNQIANLLAREDQHRHWRQTATILSGFDRQCDGGKKKYGGLQEKDLPRISMHCIPRAMLTADSGL